MNILYWYLVLLCLVCLYGFGAGNGTVAHVNNSFMPKNCPHLS